MRRLLLALLLASGAAQAQDLERERRWAAEVVPSIVVGDAVRVPLAPGRDFLGLYTEAAGIRPAVLLVHGMGVHPDHGVIGALRGALADRGYATLSLQMPVQKADAGADSYPALFPEAAERIAAGARWLAQKGHPRVVLLSHSMGARMADAYLAGRGSDAFAAWVSLGITGDYTALARMKRPVLDVAGERDFPQVLAALPARRSAIAAIPGSRQAIVPGADHYYLGREGPLADLVAGFLGELR